MESVCWGLKKCGLGKRKEEDINHPLESIGSQRETIFIGQLTFL